MSKQKYFIESKLAIYFVGKVLSAIITLLSIPLYIRWFGETDYGHYILAYTTFLVFLSVSLGWLNHALIKYYSIFKNRKCFKLKIQNIVLKSSLLASVLLCVLLYGSSQVEISTLPIILIGFLVASFYLNELVFTQVNYSALRFTISEFLRLSTCLAVVYILSQTTSINSEKILFTGILLSYIFGYLYLTRFQFPNIRVFKQKFFDLKILKRFLIYGLPIGVWMALTPSTNTIDRYVLSSSLGAAALAQYTAVYDIVFKIFTQLATPIVTIIQPLLMATFNDGDRTAYKKIRNKATIYLVVLFAPTIALLLIFEEFIITKYLGFLDKNVVASLKKVVFPIAMSSFIWQIAILLQRKIEASGKSYIVALAMIFVVTISALLSYILLQNYDYSVLGYVCLITSVLYLLIIYTLKEKR